jgi:hypothetical protein
VTELAETEMGGRMVRPYALTRGRTRSAAMELAIEALVQRSSLALAPGRPDEQVQLLARADHPISLAELAAYTRLPLGVVRVLVGDLCGEGLLDVVSHGLRAAADVDGMDADVPDGEPQVAATDLSLLERVLHGLRAL